MMPGHITISVSKERQGVMSLPTMARSYLIFLSSLRPDSLSPENGHKNYLLKEKQDLSRKVKKVGKKENKRENLPIDS